VYDFVAIKDIDVRPVRGFSENYIGKIGMEVSVWMKNDNPFAPLIGAARYTSRVRRTACIR
jgi:hypothetical protein